MYQKINKEVENKIQAIIEGDYEVSILGTLGNEGYPFLSNDEKFTKISKNAAIEYLGEENVIDLDLRMTSEDFSYFSQVAPSCFYRIGTGDGKTKKNLHTSNFDIDEKALLVSTGLMAFIALKQLAQ